ncbi:hypothetical protein E2C01_034179 [Portunus trituberculatus]|uniref:Uncharacterized protein n=1 Tax=Portunus trituberculatus TaxID=210409 RepID=A0A5B7F529_PORTR|nr:hypothetical protein [Portunus trituberculatus]
MFGECLSVVRAGGMAMLTRDTTPLRATVNTRMHCREGEKSQCSRKRCLAHIRPQDPNTFLPLFLSSKSVAVFLEPLISYVSHFRNIFSFRTLPQNSHETYGGRIFNAPDAGLGSLANTTQRPCDSPDEDVPLLAAPSTTGGDGCSSWRIVMGRGRA